MAAAGVAPGADLSRDPGETRNLAAAEPARAAAPRADTLPLPVGR